MTDTFDAVAELRVRLEGLKGAISELSHVISTGGDADKVLKDIQTKNFKRVEKSVDGLATSLGKTASAGKNAAQHLQVEQRALQSWDALEGKIKDAQEEYSRLSKIAAVNGTAAPDPRSVLSRNGVDPSRVGSIRNAQSASVLADADPSKALASLPRLRYALYDVATTAGLTATAITGIGVAAVTAFGSMESSFTNVERTLDNVSSSGVRELRDELVGLTRQIPLTFGNISEIATLGNQLGIDSSSIAKFTEVTAKFSAVTGLSAEASAQAFGSLGELLNVQSGQYEALGSSIALVGRRSVATEAEIVSMTTRLAASATNAGFTAQQVIALSGAFASLRIAPERAQGVMEIYFKRLNTAISEGGPRLEAFARVAGVTADQVENLVRTDPVQFFERLATGLGRMDQIAQTGALDELGLQGVRAGEVFGRVSANVDVFNKALQDANQGWADATELGDQYAKVVDDLASRWQIFLNAVTEAGAAVGQALAPALGVLLDVLTNTLQAFSAFASSPFGGFIMAAIGFLGAAIAAVAGLTAALALGVASTVAFKTALAELTASTGASILSLRTLSVAATQVGGAMGFSTRAIGIFKAALITTGIGAVVVLLGTLVAGMMNAANAAHGLSDELKPVADNLANAIDQDTADFFKGAIVPITTITTKVKTLKDATEEAGTAARDYAGVQGSTGAAIDGTTAKIENQTRALGANAEAVLRKHLADNEGFKTLALNPQLRKDAEKIGLDIDELVTNALRNAGGATEYLDSIRSKITAIREGLPEDQFDWTKSDESAAKYADRLDNILGLLSPVSSELDGLRSAAVATGTANEYAGLKSETAKQQISDMGDAATTTADDMFTLEQAALALEGRIFALGSSLGENGKVWGLYSEAGRSNLIALYAVLDAIAKETPDNTKLIAQNFQALYETLIRGGFATAQQLQFIQDRINGLAGGPVTAAQRDFSSLFEGVQRGAEKATKAVGGTRGDSGLTKAVRTLVDYANDLSSTMKRAFDIRFGSQQGLDQIASGWNKIADENADARQNIADYQSAIQDTADKVAELQQKLRQLGADRATKKYWLQIAELYGDQLRAAQLREEIAGIDTQQTGINSQIGDEQQKAAEATRNIALEQEKLNRSLSGNTTQAIANRAALLSLVGGYQEYLSSLAASGASQETLQRESARLRGEFIQQATSMGFSRGEVDKYAASFSDISTVIARVPRNITVGFNPNPALQALAELEAKARTSGANAGRNFASGFSSAPPLLVPPPRIVGAQTAGYIAGQAIRTGIIQGISYIKIGNKYLDSGQNSGSGVYGFASGGYTGGTSSSSVQGLVHGKEFVFNADATRTLGVNNLAFMHDMAKRGKAIAPAGMSGAGGFGDLSAASIDRLARAIAYYSKDPGIQAQAIQRAALGANATSYAQGRS